MFEFFTTALLAICVTPLVLYVYKNQGWVEDPRQKKHVKVTHEYPLSRGGGIVIFTAVLVGCLLFLDLDKYLLGILGGATLLTIVGTLDDIYDIHPLIRLITGGIAALIVVGSGIGIAYVTNPLGEGVIWLNQPQIAFDFLGKTRTVWVLADILAIIFILWNMNIVNWSKGVDGQMPGFVTFALIFIGLLSERFVDDPTQFNTMSLAFLVAGAYAGFLFWNLYPQKIMAGYGAGSLAGYFLGVLAILSGAKIAATFMVLAIPTADAIFTIVRRIRAGKSPFWGDRGHLHHKLIDVLGWGKRRVAAFYWGTTIIMGMLSLYLNTAGKIIAVTLAMFLVFTFLVWAKWRGPQHSKRA